jgi:HSP20 family molecular chaperone IbpA
MLAPSIYNDFVSNFFNGFGDMFRIPSMTEEHSGYGISTDVQEFDDHYQMDMELPGYNKEDIKAELKDGYLTISAKHSEENGEQDDNGKYIRRERCYGQCTRSFYVGKEVQKDKIHASFENGILKLDIPKEEPAPKVEESDVISIEG